MGELDKGGIRRGVEYFAPIEKDVIAIINLKERASQIYSEIYSWKLLGRTDPRLESEFKGLVMALYSWYLRAKMLKSDIYEDVPDPKDATKTLRLYKYQRVVSVIDEIEDNPSKCNLSLVLEINRVLLEFIEESGLFLKNMPRYI